MNTWIRALPSVGNCLNRLTSLTTKVLQPTSQFHSLTNGATSQISPGGLFNVTVRNVIRVHFPRPSEKKRIKRHGWKTRMSTPEGRRVIMNRILKGRFVYTH